jgi:hypothetical protein
MISISIHYCTLADLILAYDMGKVIAECWNKRIYVHF